MKEIEKILLKSQATILDALRAIDDTALEIALVIDDVGRLRGTVTDGDIRRAILKGFALTTALSEIMNRKPLAVGLETPDDEILFLMSRHSIKHLPVLDRDGKVVTLKLLKNLALKKVRPNRAVVMAGGKGTRLGKLTRNTPKPLLPVGDRPLLTTVIRQLRKHGFHNIYVSVNFEADQIVEHLGDGTNFDVNIKYLVESRPLGTAGALALLEESLDEPFLVVNGDILSAVNFANLLDYHSTSGKDMTVCVREFRFEIPYGVVHLQGNDLVSIVEKPCHQFFINAGIYVLNPKILAFLKKDSPMDMPELIKTVFAEGTGIGCFPLSEFWMDIGYPEDYLRAQGEFHEKFHENRDDSR